MNAAGDDDTRTLWLVRHGESTWNDLGLIQGHAEGPVLTAHGRMQSRDVARGLRTAAVDAIYASDLERARQTAAFVGTALGLAVHTDPALRERCFGVCEGRPLHTLDAGQSGIRDERVVDTTLRPDGGESLDDLYERAKMFVDGLEDRPHAGGVVIVTHGGTIRALRAYCAGVPMLGTRWDVVPNGSVWKIELPAIVQATKR